MTRAESWLTGLAAVLAGVFALAIASLFFASGETSALEATMLAVFVGTPAVLSALAFGYPSRRGLRGALLTAATVMLLMMSLALYLLPLPIFVVAAGASAVTWTRTGRSDDRVWPAFSLVPVTVAFWLFAVVAYAGLSPTSCTSVATAVPGRLDDSFTRCSGGVGILGAALISALLAIPLAYIAYLVRRDRPRTKAR